MSKYQNIKSKGQVLPMANLHHMPSDACMHSSAEVGRISQDCLQSCT